jgi:hypothetical protein
MTATLHVGVRYYRRDGWLYRLSWHEEIRFVSDDEWVTVRTYTHSGLKNPIETTELFRTARVGNWMNP